MINNIWSLRQKESAQLRLNHLKENQKNDKDVGSAVQKLSLMQGR